MLAARRARANSLVACHRQRCSLRGSRIRASCESLRSARGDVVSKQDQSEGVEWPTDASATCRAVRLGTAPATGLARICDPAT
eukprot:1096359-Pyramimonas_sp.AAC.1